MNLSRNIARKYNARGSPRSKCAVLRAFSARGAGLLGIARYVIVKFKPVTFSGETLILDNHRLRG